MSTKVIVRSSSPNRVSITSTQQKNIKTVSVGAATKLTNLFDVDTSDADNNETLVYDATLNKYVIKTLPVVDGGSF